MVLAQEDIQIFDDEDLSVGIEHSESSRCSSIAHSSKTLRAPKDAKQISFGRSAAAAPAAAATPAAAANPKMDDAEKAALRERVAALERQINRATAAAKATKAEQEAAVKMQSVSRGFFGRRALASKKATAALAPTPNLRVRRLPPPPIINDLPALSQARLTPIHFPPAGGGAHGPSDRGAAAQADQAAAGPD